MYQMHAYKDIPLTSRSGLRFTDLEFVATVSLTPMKMVKEGDGYDDGGTYLQYLRVPRTVNRLALAQALRDTMGASSCNHSYDCCGCAVRRVTVKMLSKRKMQVRTKVSYNY